MFLPLVSYNVPMHIGVLISERREAKGLSCYGLAGRSGVEYSYLRRIEAGQVVHPSFDTVCKIADALGCRLEKLRPDRLSPVSQK